MTEAIYRLSHVVKTGAEQQEKEIASTASYRRLRYLKESLSPAFTAARSSYASCADSE